MKLKKNSHKGVYGIICREHRLLLVKKSRGPYEGLWDLPGGRQEDGQSTEQALIREVKEETGIKVKKWRFYKVLHHKSEYEVGEGLCEFHHEGVIYFVDEFDDTNLDYDRLFEDVRGCEWKNGTNNGNFTPFARRVSEDVL